MITRGSSSCFRKQAPINFTITGTHAIRRVFATGIELESKLPIPRMRLQLGREHPDI
eukprot:gene20750-biopygen6920